MASQAQIESYVERLTPVVSKVCAERGYSQELVPAIVAQSCCETGAGESNLAKSANNLFGIRHGSRKYYMGLSYNSLTGQLCDSHNIPIDSSNELTMWRAYVDDEAAVNGYFDFLSQHSEYDNLISMTTMQEYLDEIAARGYCEGGQGTYNNSILSYIYDNNILELCKKYGNPNYLYVYTPISSIEDFSTFSDDISYTNFDIINSNISSTIKTLNTNTPNTSNKLDVGDITNNTLTTELNNSLDTINSINTALGDKINYELCSLVSNITSQTSKMDSTLASLADTLSNGTESAGTISSLIDSSSAEIKSIFTNISQKGLLSVSATNSDFGVVSSSGINSLLNSMNSSIDESSNYLSSVKNTLSSFSSDLASSGMTESSLWYVVNEKIGIYSELLDVGITSLNEYKTAVAEAAEVFNEFFSRTGYNTIDSSRRPILVNKIRVAEAEIENLTTLINTMETKTVTNADGTKTTVTDYKYSAEQREIWQKIIDKDNELIIECNKEIAAIDEFPSILNKAAQIINDALSSIYSNYGSAVNDLDVGVESTYIPPENTTYGAELTTDNEGSTPTAGGYAGGGSSGGGDSEGYSGGDSEDYIESNDTSKEETEEELDNNSETKETKSSDDETDDTKTQTDTNKTKDEDTKEETDTKTTTDIKETNDTDSKQEKTSSTQDTTKTTILGTNTGGITSSLSSSVSRNIPSRVNYNSNKNSNVTSNTTNDGITAEIVPEDDTVIIEPVIEPPVVEEDTITPIDPVIDGSTTSTTSQTSSSNKTLKTLGTLAAAGAAVGAAAFGAHTYMKTRENKEEDENYD